MRWAERRALRLYIHAPEHRAALRQIRYREPLLAELWQVIETLEGVGGGGAGLRGLLMGLIAPLAEQGRQALAEALRHLCQPAEEVLRVMRANPSGELEGALQLLQPQHDTPPAHQVDTTPDQ